MAWADSRMNSVHRGVDAASIGARIKFVSVGRLSRGFVPVVLALFALANWVLGLRKVVCLLMSGLAA